MPSYTYSFCLNSPLTKQKKTNLSSAPSFIIFVCNWEEQEEGMKSFTLQIILNTTASMIFLKHESENETPLTKKFTLFP